MFSQAKPMSSSLVYTQPTRRSWLYTVLSRFPWPDWVTASAVVVVYFGVYLLLLAARTGTDDLFNRIQAGVRYGSLMLLVEFMLLIHLERATQAFLRYIRPAVQLDDTRYAELEARCLHVPWREDLVPLAMSFMGPVAWYSYAAADTADPILRAYHLLGVFLVTVGMMHLMGAVWRGIRISRRVQQQPLAIDIFDSDDLLPIAIYSLGISLPGPVLIGLMVVIWGVNTTGLTALMYVMTLGLSGMAFFMPLQGLHERMIAAKGRELEAIQTRVRGAYERLNRSSPEDEPECARTLAHLLAAEVRVLSAPTWPFNISILSQLAATLIIPIALAVLQVWLGRL